MSAETDHLVTVDLSHLEKVHGIRNVVACARVRPDEMKSTILSRFVGLLRGIALTALLAVILALLLAGFGVDEAATLPLGIALSAPLVAVISTVRAVKAAGEMPIDLLLVSSETLFCVRNHVKPSLMEDMVTDTEVLATIRLSDIAKLTHVHAFWYKWLVLDLNNGKQARFSEFHLDTLPENFDVTFGSIKKFWADMSDLGVNTVESHKGNLLAFIGVTIGVIAIVASCARDFGLVG